jgi:hypothetical protein
MLGDCIRFSMFDELGGGLVNDENMCQNFSLVHTGDKTMGTLELSEVAGLSVLIFACCASLGGPEINH